ncbi:MAG: prolyl oligopeptidase family serine peptidase, partial [Candidatus Njordarchaeales archaeon]
SLETVDEIKGDIHGVLWLDKDRIYYVRFFRSEKTPDGIPPPASRVFLREEGKEEMVFGQGLPPMYFIGLDRSRFSDHVLAIVSYGWTESMAYGGPLRDPNKWEKIYEGRGYIVYPVEYVNNRYLITSFEKNMGCILSVRNGEKEILIDEWEFPLQSAVVVEDRILVHYLQHASSILKIFNFRGELLDKVISDVPGTISSLDSNGMEAVFLFQSFWIPYRIYIFSLDKMELLESNEVSNDYIVEEDFTTSKDGTKIHLFIVRKRNSPIRNVLLFGYGGFRISITPSFVPSVLPFIDDGGAYAIANIRGGLEYGEEWHRQGMRENKQNVFDDFMAAIEYFRKKGARVVATGRSNGGLLVGAVLTQRPELLDGALIGYPVLDMLRFHKLYIGRAWVPEYGDPDNPKDAEFLRKYSPYHNISRDKKYPPTLVYTGLHDDRVHPAHALKFVARLKEVGAPVYLRVETVSGHAGASPEIRLKEYSDTLAFVYTVLNMTTSKDSSS